MDQTIVIIGGGAAGFFAAVTCAQVHKNAKVILIEKTNALLSKVRISGGGRCNVTHACFNPNDLIKNYPRGGKELLGAFHRFQPKDTIAWFEKRGVSLKIEDDGRMFPITDNSETIISCLLEEAKKTNVEIRKTQQIDSIKKSEDDFTITFSNGDTMTCQKVILATGSNKEGYKIAESFGHTIIPTVPSLFTFNIPESTLNELSGISVDPVSLKIEGTNLAQQGPLLITHWGFSGPAALKLSAWGARILNEMGYEATLKVNWVPSYSQDELYNLFLKFKAEKAQQDIGHTNLPTIPKQLWKHLLAKASIDAQKKLKDLPNKQLLNLSNFLQNDLYQIKGKTTYKQEFVTSGGVNLKEVNFKTMESRKCPGLYFVGEILDIDAITGGFNFQNAWTTGWIAGNSVIGE